MFQGPSNPAILSPASRFSISQYRSQSRSPSRSPNRRQHFTSHEIDPLLSNLSPTSTLEALTATDAISIDERGSRSLLQASIADSSTSQRALGIRAALAGKKLREWYTEVKGWQWPTTGFEDPFKQQGLRKRRKHGDGPHSTDLEKVQTGAEEDDYWGSLPPRMIEQFEERIDVIRDDMETLEVEELKGRVRSAHVESRPRPLSIYGVQEPSLTSRDYNHLDGFTAIITATIMHALPYISRLNILLDVWSSRLVVLRQVPGFLYRLEEIQAALDSAWHVLAEDNKYASTMSSKMSREAFIAMRSVLEGQVSELGQRIDAMLDSLDEDSLPDVWIEGVDSAEASLASWIVEAERHVSDTEWLQLQEQAKSTKSLETEESKILTKHGQELITDNTFDQRDSGISLGQGVPYFDTQEGCDRPSASRDDNAFPNSMSTPTIDDGRHTVSLRYDSGTATSDGVNDVEAISYAFDAPDIAGPFFKDSNSNTHSTLINPNLVQTVLEAPGNLAREAGSSSRRKLENHTSNGIGGPIASLAHQTLKLPAQKDVSNNHNETISVILTQMSLSSAPIEVENKLSDNQRDNICEAKVSDMPNIDKKQDDFRSVLETEISLSQPESRLQGQRPPPLTFHSHHGRTDSDISDVSFASSTTSNFSNMSSPEILDASRAEYFSSPTEVVTPGWIGREFVTQPDAVSRQSSQRTDRGVSNTQESETFSELASPRPQRSRAPSFAPEPTIHESHELFEASEILDEDGTAVPVLKRASIASIEVLAKSEVRSVSIRRSGSYSSTSSAISRIKTDLGGSNHAGKAQSHEPDYGRESSVQDATHLLSPVTLDDRQDTLDLRLLPNQELQNSGSQQVTAGFATSPPILPNPPRKDSDRLKFTISEDIVSSPQQHQLQDSEASAATTPETTEDKLEARISSILTNIPAEIRLASGPEIDALVIQRSNASSASKKVEPASSVARLSRTQTSSITLAPAYSKSRSQSGDSEIKLYHLHQPGKDIPIKLYIRLVGEGKERVMVRVGGGWADLGEYLKEYADHHGRRSTMESKVDLQGQTDLPRTPLGGLPIRGTTPTHRPETPTPHSSQQVNSKKTRSSGGSPFDFRAFSTPELPSARQQDVTHGSPDSFTPSLRPSSRMSWTEEDAPLGLAGPTSKKKDVSPGKQAWVDNMIDQARNASAEKKRGSLADFGDLGKVGNTKRVFIKSRRDDFQ